MRTSTSPAPGCGASGISIRRNCFGSASWIAFIGARDSSQHGLEVNTRQLFSVTVQVCDRGNLRLSIDAHRAEELFFRVRAAGFRAFRSRREFELGAERSVESAGGETRRVQRPA